MKPKKEFIQILDEMILTHNNRCSLKHYAFVCSKIWDEGITIHKGIPVYYFNAKLMGDKIQLQPSPMFKDYEI
jgi:hypothetical protein